MYRPSYEATRVAPAPVIHLPSRMWYRYSSRNNLILLVIGLVAASPNGQNDLPLMLSQMSISRSTSLSLPCPCSIRSRISVSQYVPSRQGVHLPHDSSR